MGATVNYHCPTGRLTRPSSGTPTDVTACRHASFASVARGGLNRWLRAVERDLDSTLARPYTHVTSLDFSNAFNTVGRRDIAEGLRQYAPVLYLADRWAYGSTSSLVLSSPVGKHIITSAQAVRQGDTMGLLIFPLGGSETSLLPSARTSPSWPTSTTSTSSARMTWPWIRRRPSLKSGSHPSASTRPSTSC
jgi:hypothetical protein